MVVLFGDGGRIIFKAAIIIKTFITVIDVLGFFPWELKPVHSTYNIFLLANITAVINSIEENS